MGKPRAPSMLEDAAFVVASAFGRRPGLTTTLCGLLAVWLAVTDSTAARLFGALLVAAAAHVATAQSVTRRGDRRSLVAAALLAALLVVVLATLPYVKRSYSQIRIGVGVPWATCPEFELFALVPVALITVLGTLGFAACRGRYEPRSKQLFRRGATALALAFVTGAVCYWNDLHVGMIPGRHAETFTRPGMGGLLVVGILLAGALRARLAWVLGAVAAVALVVTANGGVFDRAPYLLFGLAATFAGRVGNATLDGDREAAAERLVVRLQTSPLRSMLMISALLVLTYMTALTLGEDAGRVRSLAELGEVRFTKFINAALSNACVIGIIMGPAVLGVIGVAAAPPGATLLRVGGALVGATGGGLLATGFFLLETGGSGGPSMIFQVLAWTVSALIAAWALGRTPGLLRGGPHVDFLLALVTACALGHLMTTIDRLPAGLVMLTSSWLLHRIARARHASWRAVGWGGAVGLALLSPVAIGFQTAAAPLRPLIYGTLVVAPVAIPTLLFIRAVRYAHTLRAIPPEHARYADFGITVRDALIVSAAAEREVPTDVQAG